MIILIVFVSFSHSFRIVNISICPVGQSVGLNVVFSVTYNDLIFFTESFHSLLIPYILISFTKSSYSLLNPCILYYLQASSLNEVLPEFLIEFSHISHTFFIQRSALGHDHPFVSLSRSKSNQQVSKWFQC